jgi:hypothetical protein
MSRDNEPYNKPVNLTSNYADRRFDEEYIRLQDGWHRPGHARNMPDPPAWHLGREMREGLGSLAYKLGPEMGRVTNWRWLGKSGDVHGYLHLVSGGTLFINQANGNFEDAARYAVSREAAMQLVVGAEASYGENRKLQRLEGIVHDPTAYSWMGEREGVDTYSNNDTGKRLRLGLDGQFYDENLRAIDRKVAIHQAEHENHQGIGMGV